MTRYQQQLHINLHVIVVDLGSLTACCNVQLRSLQRGMAISVRGVHGDTGEQCNRGAKRAHVIIVRGGADDQCV